MQWAGLSHSHRAMHRPYEGESAIHAEPGSVKPGDSAASSALPWLAIGLPSLIALLVFLYAASLTRFTGDDFCYASSLDGRSVLEALSDWYAGWTGRFASTSLVLILSQLGPGIAPVAGVGYIAGSFVVVATLLKRNTSLGALEVAALASACAYLALAGTPDIYQSIFWLIGGLSYGLPLIYLALSALSAWEFARFERRWCLIPLPFLGVLTAGSSETAAVFGLTASGLTFLASLVVRDATGRRVRIALLAFIVPSLLATAVVIAAPGNAVRQAYFLPHPSPLSLMTQLVEYLVRLVGRVIVRQTMVVAFMAALGILLARLTISRSRPTREIDPKLVLTLSIAAFLTAGAVTYLPGIWAINGIPPARARNIAAFAFLAFVGVVGYLIGVKSSRRSRGSAHEGSRLRPSIIAGAYAVIVISPLAAAIDLSRTLEPLSRYADFIPALEAKASLARGKVLIIDWPEPVAVGPLATDLFPPDSDPSSFTNVCIADYYGLEGFHTHP